MSALRRVFLAVVLPICFGYTVGEMVGCGGSQLTPADQESIARDTIEIAVCQDEARRCKADAGDAAAAKCWPVYDACMQSAGLKDGGSHE